MKSIKLATLILLNILSLQLCSCVRNTSPSDDIYSDSYINSSLQQYKPLNSEAGMTERDAVNTALSNNPEYKIKQLKAVSAEAGYYSSLLNLTPNVSISNKSGVNTTYQVSPSSVMGVLMAKALADKAQYDVDDYRRELVKDINITHSNMQEDEFAATIQKENEEFQREMASNMLRKKTSTSDILDFKINELKAKAAAIEAEKKYKTNSYALAANMGITSAELPANIGTQKSILLKSMNNDKKSWRNLNYYLNVAIKNRLDLKAHKAALRAAKYDLYSAAGELTPRVNATVKNSNASVSASERLSPGRNLAGMRIKGADYAMQQENLHKKWISIVKEVKEAYLKLTMQLAIRKILESTMQMAKQRRDMAAKQYNAGKTKSIAILSQAQQDLVNAQKSFIKAEKELHDARAELYAACGIQNDKTKKPKHYNIESGTR